MYLNSYRGIEALFIIVVVVKWVRIWVVGRKPAIIWELSVTDCNLKAYRPSIGVWEVCCQLEMHFKLVDYVINNKFWKVSQ